MMNLLNVRKGQFVYYKNKLHKVYSVKPFLKTSVHLIRLYDYEQDLATAKEIDYYKPKHLDSFVFNHQRYTLDQHTKAKVGDYILVIDPRPDSLDSHHLHAIEIVSSIENNGVITNKANGIKHNEYWVMVPGLLEEATIIDLQEDSPTDMEKISKLEQPVTEPITPKIGDIYQKNDSDPILQTMVTATEGTTVYLGHNIKVSIDELTNSEKWSYMHNIFHQ